MTEQFIEVQYRDAANYKDNLTIENLSHIDVQVGQEITMEEFGYTQEDFFKRYLNHEYNGTYDHNLLEITQVPAPALTTEQAFKVLLRDKFARVSIHTKKTWKRRQKAGKLSNQVIRQALLKAGYKPVQETLWVKE